MDDKKVCTKCKELKSISSFSKRKDKNKILSRCKQCHNAYISKWKNENSERDYSNKRSRKDLIKEWFQQFKQSPCADCKQVFPPCCMDFDHKEYGSKKKNVAILVGEGYSKEIILKEIAKCDLVCANCHRIRTRERGWALWDKCKRKEI